jgi:hypothetical protein
MIHDEEHYNKSRRVESQNGGSRWEMTHRERSPHKGSRHESHHKEKSHWERRHHEKSQHDESRYSHRNKEVEDLKKKYAHILSRMDTKDPKTTAWDMLDDETLPFSKRVKAYTMPDKFKMSRVEK